MNEGSSFLTAHEAEARAKRECEARRWPWTTPIRVTRRRDGYTVWTNAGMRGGNVIVALDGRTGEVKYAFYAPR